MTGNVFESLSELYANPLLKKAFIDFCERAQKDGMASARQFWGASPDHGAFPGNVSDLFEMMTQFYSQMGFVPKKQYDEACDRIEKLEEENRLLKAALVELNAKIFTESGVKMQEAWTELMKNQMNAGVEMAKGFMDLLKAQEDDSSK